MRFFKMNGLGNDYIFVDRANCPNGNITDFVRKMCDVHTGVGADGVVTYEKGDTTDLIMHIYNRDGSEAEMCGNALRCLIRHYDMPKKNVTVLTRCGVKSGVFDGEYVTVNLSKPVSVDTNMRIIEVNGRQVIGKSINVGNPHFIINGLFDNDIAESISENTKYFPNRTNVEFFNERNGELFVRVYERGCGETLACGTGAAAVFVGSGYTEADVHLLGGTLTCFFNADGEIMQKGKVAYNFQGEWEYV